MKPTGVKIATTSRKVKWSNLHIWFLRIFLTALALSHVNVSNWLYFKNCRNKIKFSIVGACTIVTLVFYIKLNIDTHNTHELDSEQSPAFPCRRTPEQARELRELFFDVHEILQSMNIRHFLIYGSIWGAYRAKGPLAWDYDIDLAVVGDENFSKIPKSVFLKPFRERGMNVVDKMILSSCFYFTRGDFAQVDVDVFFDYDGWMQRSGLVTWFLYYNYRKYHRFPAWMVRDPLPKMPFLDLQMAVPRGGKEILKYLYPNDWDTPFIPAACRLEAKQDKINEIQTNFSSQNLQ